MTQGALVEKPVRPERADSAGTMKRSSTPTATARATWLGTAIPRPELPVDASTPAPGPT